MSKEQIKEYLTKKGWSDIGVYQTFKKKNRFSHPLPVLITVSDILEDFTKQQGEREKELEKLFSQEYTHHAKALEEIKELKKSVKYLQSIILKP